MRAHRPIAAPALALVALAALPGCSMNKLVADNMASSLADQKAAFKREASVRQAREASPALLSMLDGFIASSPRNEDLLLAGAEMNAEAAFAFFERDLDDVDEGNPWARATYAKARDYALRALAEEDEDLHRAVTEGDDEAFAAALAALEPDDDAIPALYWSAFARGAYINVTKTDMDAVADLPRVVAIMRRLAEIAPDLQHAGPYLFLAVYESSRGAALGGDLEAARRHFEEVFRRTGDRLLVARVLFAELYCVALGAAEPAEARELFTRSLTYVLVAPDDLWPEERLANQLAKRWAEELLPELDDLIFPPLPPE